MIDDNQISDFEPILKQFSNCHNPQETIEQLIALGDNLPRYEEAWKSDENRVEGCQSLTYMHTRIEQDRLFFFFFSEALVSRGLAALLRLAYDGKKPIFILRSPPTFLQTLGLHTALSPGRTAGVANIYLRMQKRALHHLT